MRNGTYYLNNTGHRWVVFEDGKKPRHTFTTSKGEQVTRTAIFYESFGNFSTACISWKGKKIKVFLDQILPDSQEEVNAINRKQFHRVKAREYTLPAHYASYLINADPSGLDDEEYNTIQEWEKGKGHCVGTTEETPEYRHGHALNANQGADCYTFIFIK